MKVTVLKDGHQFVVHVVDPKDDPFAEEEPILDENSDTRSHSEKEKAEVESSEKEGKFLIVINFMGSVTFRGVW